jgi:hypothetical protein
MSQGEMAMWKRRETWIAIALMFLLNILAWDIRTGPQVRAGAIPLYEHQVATGIEYTVLRPARFYLDSVWYSYAVALFIGLALPFLLAPPQRQNSCRPDKLTKLGRRKVERGSIRTSV